MAGLSAACGGGGGTGAGSQGGQGTGSSPSATTSRSNADPLAGTSAAQVLSEAVANLKSAPTFHMSGTAPQPDGTTYNVSLEYKQGTGCKGTLAQPGKGSFGMIVIGKTAWLKPDEAFWRANLGADAPRAIALVGGKYLKSAPGKGNLAPLTEMCDVNSMASALLHPTGPLVKGKVTTVNGQQVLPLKSSAEGTLYVTDTSSPQPVKFVSTTPGKQQQVTFEVGAPVTLTAPPPSQTIDGALFGF